MEAPKRLETRERLDAPQMREISSLNAADLDIEELESRLEIAAAVPNTDCWANACGINLA